MKGEAVSGVMLTLLLISMLTLAFNIQQVEASGTIYIKADGSVDPPTANIASVDNVTYTFTGNIYESIVVQRDNIVVDGAKYTLQGPLIHGGNGITLTGRSNITVKNVEIIGFDYAIYLHWSSNNSISGNKITHAWATGIRVYESSRNMISGNSITNNWVRGIDISKSSTNIIWENKIANNYEGLSLDGSSKNIISGNSITNNGEGIHFLRSSYNSIHHNNFVNNTPQVGTYDSVNIWDDGYPSGGNYWSDYTGKDKKSGPDQREPNSDGIGDTPYIIDEYNQDNYPLMRPWTLITGDVNGDGKVDVSDLLHLSKAYGTELGKPSWNQDCDFNKDQKVDALDLFDLSKNYGKTA